MASGMIVRIACLVVAAVLVSSGLLAGCATTSDLETLANRVAALELDRARLKAEMEQDVGRLANLHEKLVEAEETLRRSGVKLGYRMEQVEATLPQLKGGADGMTVQLGDMRRDVDTVRREVFDRLGATAVYLPPELPETADAAWELGGKLVKADKRREAKALYDWYEAQFTSDPRADDALMRVAALYESDGDIGKAIKLYQAVHDRHPEGDQVTRALWRIAELFELQEDCERAHGVYVYLANAYKDTPQGKKAVPKANQLKAECLDDE